MIELIIIKEINYNNNFVTTSQGKETIKKIEEEVKRTLNIDDLSKKGLINAKQVIENYEKNNKEINKKPKRVKSKKYKIKYFLNLEEFFIKMDKKIGTKLKNTLKQIDLLLLKDYKELISFAIRPILEITINLFFNQISNHSENEEKNRIKMKKKISVIYKYFKMEIKNKKK